MYKWTQASRSLLATDTGLFVKHVEHEEEKQSLEGEVESVIIASEPLYRAEEAWNLVPPNHVVVVTPKNDVTIEPIDLSAIEEEELCLNESYTGLIIAHPARQLTHARLPSSPSPFEKEREEKQEGEEERRELPSISIAASEEGKDDLMSSTELEELVLEKSLAERKRTRPHVQASLSLLVREQHSSPSPILEEAKKQEHGGGLCLVLPEDECNTTVATEDGRVRKRHRSPSFLSDLSHQRQKQQQPQQQQQPPHHAAQGREEGDSHEKEKEKRIVREESVVVEWEKREDIPEKKEDIEVSSLQKRKEEASITHHQEKATTAGVAAIVKDMLMGDTDRKISIDLTFPQLLALLVFFLLLLVVCKL